MNAETIKKMGWRDLVRWVAHTENLPPILPRHMHESREESERFYDQGLRDNEDRFSPDGFVALESQMLDSSKLGRRYVLPFGGRSSHPTPPEQPFSIDGTASGTVCVVGIHYLTPGGSRE